MNIHLWKRHFRIFLMVLATIFNCVTTSFPDLWHAHGQCYHWIFGVGHGVLAAYLIHHLRFCCFIISNVIKVLYTNILPTFTPILIEIGPTDMKCQWFPDIQDGECRNLNLWRWRRNEVKVWIMSKQGTESTCAASSPINQLLPICVHWINDIDLITCAQVCKNRYFIYGSPKNIVSYENSGEVHNSLNCSATVNIVQYSTSNNNDYKTIQIQ